MSTISASASHINPVNERLYKQSNLLGDWKGNFKKTNGSVEFKVLSINGTSAQVEFTHNGHTERGTATVDKNSISFGNVTIATRNGTQAAFEFDFQPSGQLASTGTQTAVLSKDATASADTNPLVGSWTGATVDHTASFTVSSINGRDAQVKYAVDGRSGQGTGDVSQEFGSARQRVIQEHRRKARHGDVPDLPASDDHASRHEVRSQDCLSKTV